MFSAAFTPRVFVTHCTSRWLAIVFDATRSRLKCSMPTSRPRPFRLCLSFCASQPALPPHFRSKRTLLVSSNSAPSG